MNASLISRAPTWAVLTLGLGTAGFDLCAGADPVQIPVSVFADHLVYEGTAIQEPNFTVWGGAPIVDHSGFTHLYVARWPEPNVDPAWRRSSEIAHYRAARPEGPFRFVEVVVQGTGRTGEWDAFAPHNPEVKRFDDTYALVYIANSDFRQPPHPLNQSIGMMTATSPYGPWTKVGNDGLILDDQVGHFSEGRQVVNPALIRVGERYFLYYKTTARQDQQWRTRFGLAVADRLEGPYVHQPDPVTSEGVVIEDASVFMWKGKICLLTTDNHGLVSGLAGGLALWVSDDGIHFRKDWIQLGMRLFPDYLPEDNLQTVKRIYGPAPKAERPKVLTLDGEPAYLYVASGWAYNGSPRCENHVFKMVLPPGASPLPGRPVQREPSPNGRNPVFGVNEDEAALFLNQLGAEMEQGVTRTQIEAYSKHFDRLDQDGDGRHAKVEYIDNGTYLTPQARREIFAAADNDQDGVVTQAEYILNRIVTDEAKHIVQAMDENGDGFVQREEFIRNATPDRALAGQIFEALDTDNSGDIHVPEYLRVWGQWARAGRPPPPQRLAPHRAGLPSTHPEGVP